MRPVDRDFPTAEQLQTPRIANEELWSVAKWLLGEPRPSPIRWWIPSASDLKRLERYGRPSEGNSKDYDESAAAAFV